MTPFATPVLAALDALRIAVFAWGFLLVGLQLRLWPLLTTVGQRVRLAAMALALFVLAGSRITNLGQTITWQMVASVVVFGLVTVSTFGRYRVDRRG